MEGINLNASMNKKTDNVFDFIEEKLAFGVGDWEYYLTPIGSYIVNGSPFGSSLSEWANEYGLDEFSMRATSILTAKKIIMEQE